MKRAVAIIAAVAAIVACADISRTSPPRGLRWPDMKIRLCQDDKHGYVVSEDVSLFYATFAQVDYPKDVLNYAEGRQMAVAVARAVANYLGSTNDIRIVHWEQPKPADTNNIGDVLNSWLKGKFVTDEIVPLRQGGK
jgi:hypothetical protein